MEPDSDYLAAVDCIHTVSKLFIGFPSNMEQQHRNYFPNMASCMGKSCFGFPITWIDVQAEVNSLWMYYNSLSWSGWSDSLQRNEKLLDWTTIRHTPLSTCRREETSWKKSTLRLKTIGQRCLWLEWIMKQPVHFMSTRKLAWQGMVSKNRSTDEGFNWTKHHKAEVLTS